jgi:SAM-dependent methyltransferase
VVLSTYAQYLAAKKSVDDRALNAGVLQWVISRLRNIARPARVLEIGAGLGTMPSRLLELGAVRGGEYTLLDNDARLLRDARAWLEAWSSERGWQATRDGDALVVRGPETSLTLHFLHRELESFLETEVDRGAYDCLIGNALLDLIDVRSTLPRLLRLLVRGGTYWFSVNFDGETIFLPEHPSDAQLMHVYHRSMDERLRDGHPAGDSKTGRHLFTHLREAGARIAKAGSSDWVVFGEDGRYPAKEAEFLDFILRTVERELQQHADVERGALAEWVQIRRAQLERRELVYIAHQLDFAGTFDGRQF